uniref:nociceptin receptor-like n=1 Tax=Styela clava TaxID=7725 RepID=UPI001939F5BA|nr:nociceptin receptor-like [Styela clava]
MAEVLFRNFTEFANSPTMVTSTEKNVEPYDMIFSLWEGVLVTTILGILCVFGLIANAVTFFVICTSKTLRKSSFNILIMSLCVSDFLSALNSPFQMYRRIWGFLEFELPVGFCKFTIGLGTWTMFVTVQHILVFSVFRLLAMQFPNKIGRITPKIAKITAVVIWIEVFIVSALFYIMTSSVIPYKPGRYKTACTSVSKDWRPIAAEYTTYALPILLFAPFIGILLCAIIITYILIKIRKRRATQHTTNNKQKQEQERMALIQVTLIVLSFFIGYSVESVYRMTKALDLRDLFTVRTKWVTLTTAYVLLRVSECLNPLFYNFGSSQMREKTKKFLRTGDVSSAPNSISSPTMKTASPHKTTVV